MVKVDGMNYYRSSKWNNRLSDGFWSFIVPKEIVETWEPVYKEVKKIRVEAGEYTKEELIKMAETINN